MRILFLILAILLGGCTTSSNKTAYKSANSVIIAVDSAMKVWADYVVRERIKLAGNPAALAVLAQKERDVKKTYEKYQNAITAFIMGGHAISANLTNSVPVQVSSALLEAAQPVLTLVAQFAK